MIWGLYHGLLLVLHRIAHPWLDRIKPVDTIDRACWTGLRIRRHVSSRLFWLVDLSCRLARASRRNAGCDCAASVYSVRRISDTGVLQYSRSGSCSLFQYAADDLDVIGRTPWYVRGVFYTACFYAIVLVGQFGGSSLSISSSVILRVELVGGQSQQHARHRQRREDRQAGENACPDSRSLKTTGFSK